jgi:hypothetical protein
MHGRLASSFDWVLETPGKFCLLCFAEDARDSRIQGGTADAV